jgi:type VI secretion system protein ImpE
MDAAQQALRDGDPKAALDALQQQVRGDASNPKLRIFLFQLLAVTGQWPRALTQLQLCGELDHGALAMVQTYREAIQCEALRDAVFAGKATPHVMGKPQPWIAKMIQALAADAQGDGAGAHTLRSQAMDEAPARPGTIVVIGSSSVASPSVRAEASKPRETKAFEWIADADSRLGPILEVIINGRYGWLPIDGIAKLTIEAPSDLRDMVWLPASLEFPNGGGTVALLPALYAGTAASGDGALQLGRRTDWLDIGHGQYRGLGQKLLATDGDEIGLFDARELSFADDAEGPTTLASEI